MTGIEIICNAPSHNNTRATIVRRFHYFTGLKWAAEEMKSPRPRHAYAGQALDSNSRPISRGKVDRVTYSLKCPRCGNAVAVREENLYAVFDKFRDHLPDTGYFTISLDILRRALAANL